jgi:hypothetical protein
LHGTRLQGGRNGEQSPVQFAAMLVPGAVKSARCIILICRKEELSVFKTYGFKASQFNW